MTAYIRKINAYVADVIADDPFDDDRFVFVNDCQYPHWEATVNGAIYHIRLSITLPKIYTVTRLDDSGILWATNVWASEGDEDAIVSALEAIG